VLESLGRAKVATVFDLRGSRGKVASRVAGCRVLMGTMNRSTNVRLIRNEEVVWEGAISSLKHFKEDVQLAEKGSECGIILDGFQELQQHDIIECFRLYLEREKITVISPDAMKQQRKIYA
jgi:translation initiation factor IF-2